MTQVRRFMIPRMSPTSPINPHSTIPPHPVGSSRTWSEQLQGEAANLTRVCRHRLERYHYEYSLLRVLLRTTGLGQICSCQWDIRY